MGPTNLQPQIAGTILDVTGGLSSPPSDTGTVYFATPLEGLANNYVVMLTGVNTANTFVAGYIEEDGNFIGFTVVTDDGGDVHYIVTKKGIRAKF